RTQYGFDSQKATIEKYDISRYQTFTQTHMICEDPAEAEVAEEGQPGEAAFLVGAELAAERGRGGDRREPAVGLAGQQVAEPAVGVDLGHRDAVARAEELRAAQPGGKRVRGSHSPALAPLEVLQRGLQVPVVELHPLAPQPDQRDLEPGQFLQFVRVQDLVADGQLIPEIDQVAQAELR